MKEHSVSSLLDLLSQRFQSKFPFAIHRGEDGIYPYLIPRIGRLILKVTKGLTIAPSDIPKGELISFEKDIVSGFGFHARPYMSPNEALNPEAELVFLAQHYGVPTRLLDWTGNLLVATAFAVLNEKKSDRRVFSLEFEMEALEIHGGIYTTNQLLRKKPPKIDRRIVNQDSTFTVHPKPWEDLRTTIQPLKGMQLMIFRIPKSSVGRIKNELNELGIREDIIFPDLSGVGNYIDRTTPDELTRRLEALVTKQ